jgi:hypothetical protein
MQSRPSQPDSNEMVAGEAGVIRGPRLGLAEPSALTGLQCRLHMFESIHRRRLVARALYMAVHSRPPLEDQYAGVRSHFTVEIYATNAGLGLRDGRLLPSNHNLETPSGIL